MMHQQFDDVFANLCGHVPETEPQEFQAPKAPTVLFDLNPRRTRMLAARERSFKRRIQRILRRIFNRGNGRRMAYAVESFATKLEDKVQEGRQAMREAARAGVDQIEIVIDQIPSWTSSSSSNSYSTVNSVNWDYTREFRMEKIRRRS